MRRVEAAFWADLARITTSLALVLASHPIRRVVAEVLQEVILADVVGAPVVNPIARLFFALPGR